MVRPLVIVIAALFASLMAAPAFSAAPVVDETSAKRADTQAFAAFFGALLDHGVYIAPSQFEAGFVSLAHSDDDIARTVDAAQVAMRQVAAR